MSVREQSATQAPREDRVASRQDRRNLTLGVLCGLATSLVWSGWAVATRFAMTTELGPHDVTFLRYSVSSLCLLPVLLRSGIPMRRIGLVRLVVMVTGAGAPFMLLGATGLQFAPASHIATLMIGAMPLFVSLLSALFFAQRFLRLQLVGFAAVACGVALVGGRALLFERASGGEWRGDLLFVLCGILFAGYTIAQRRSGITAWHAAALVSTCSTVVFAPVYLLVLDSRLMTAPWQEVAFQAFAQGIGIAIIGLLLYGEAVRRLGAPRGAVFGALVPGLAALLAAPLLGELPPASTLVGIALVSAGVVLVTGVPGSLRRSHLDAHVRK